MLQFINEFGNEITITVGTKAPDIDAVCTTCRWRSAHAPDCTDRKTPWPQRDLPQHIVRISIEGPSSFSENFLTRAEAEHLRDALVAELGDGR